MLLKSPTKWLIAENLFKCVSMKMKNSLKEIECYHIFLTSSKYKTEADRNDLSSRKEGRNITFLALILLRFSFNIRY